VIQILPDGQAPCSATQWGKWNFKGRPHGLGNRWWIVKRKPSRGTNNEWEGIEAIVFQAIPTIGNRDRLAHEREMHTNATYR